MTCLQKKKKIFSNSPNTILTKRKNNFHWNTFCIMPALHYILLTMNRKMSGIQITTTKLGIVHTNQGRHPANSVNEKPAKTLILRNCNLFLVKMHLPQIYLKRYHEIRYLFPQIDSFLLNFFLDNKKFLNNTHYTSPNKQLNCADWCYIENIIFRFHFRTARSTKKPSNFSNHSTSIGLLCVMWLQLDQWE